MKRRIKQTLVAGAMALAFSASTAFALPATSTAFTPGAVNTFSDDNVELHYDNNSNTLIDVGDYLFGLIAITSFGPSSTPGNAVNQMSGVYAVQVDTITPLPGLACGSALLTTCSLYTFVPVPDFNALLATVGLGALDPSVGMGDTIALLFEDLPGTLVPTPVEGGTINGNFAAAADGALRLVIQQIAANGDSFSGVAPANPAQFGLVTQGQGVGSISLDLTISEQFYPGFNLGPDITGSGNISQAAAGPFFIRSDTTFSTFIQRVPEPGTLSLMGLGLLGLAMMGRRRKV